MYKCIHIHTCMCVCARVRVLYIYVYARMHDLEVLLHMIKMIQADEDLQVPERFFFFIYPYVILILLSQSLFMRQSNPPVVKYNNHRYMLLSLTFNKTP